MLLPSSADLVRAFITDLGNVFEAGQDQKPQQQIFMWRATGACTWKADRDCMITGLFASTHAVVTTIGMAYGGESQGTRTSGIIYIHTASANPFFFPLRYVLHHGDVVTYDSDIAGAALILLIE